jgi:hypothetical protein
MKTWKCLLLSFAVFLVACGDKEATLNASEATPNASTAPQSAAPVAAPTPGASEVPAPEGTSKNHDFV